MCAASPGRREIACDAGDPPLRSGVAQDFRNLNTFAPAARALAFVCRKCGQTADDLRFELKRAAKAQLPKKTLRVVLTECQDVCPETGVAVSLVVADRPGVHLVVKPDDVDRVVKQVIEALK